MTDKSISDESDAAEALNTCVKVTGLAMAARNLMEDPTSGYEAEVEAGVIAILDTIKELSETVGAYLADHAVTGVSHV
jgi:hypothetical protein